MPLPTNFDTELPSPSAALAQPLCDVDQRSFEEWFKDALKKAAYVSKRNPSEASYSEIENRNPGIVLKDISRFVRKTKNPQIRTYRQFATVLGVAVEELRQERASRPPFNEETAPLLKAPNDASAGSSNARFYLQFLAEPIPYCANPDVASVALGNQEPTPDGYLDIAPNASFPKHRYPAKVMKAQLRVVVPQEWRVKQIDELKGILLRELDGALIRLRPDPRPVVYELRGQAGADQRLNSYVCEIEAANGGSLYDVYIRMSGEPPLLKFQGVAQGQTVQMQLITHLEDLQIEELNVDNPRKKKVIELLRLHKARMLPDPDRGYIVLTDIMYEVAEE